MPDRTVRFVTSTSRQGRRAHVGTGRTPLCGTYLVNEVRVTANFPADRHLCPRCAQVAVAEGAMSKGEAEILLAYEPVVRDYDDLIALLRQDTDAAVARALGVSLRTVVRRVHDGMTEVGARTRFDFGYRVAQRKAATGAP